MQLYELKKDLLYEKLKSEILDGKYDASQKLPKEIDFARQLDVAKVTLRSALSRLEEEGLVARIHGKGTFVVPEKAKKRDILVIVGNLNEFANPSIYILEGIKNAAVKNGINIKICDRQYLEALTPKAFAQNVRDNKISGIIAIASYFIGDEYLLRLLKSSGVPVLLPHAFSSDCRVTGFATIVPEQAEGCMRAIEYLSSQGHKRIATIVHTLSPNLIRGYNKDGYKDLLKKYGADTDDKLIKFMAYEKEDTIKAVNEWMKLSEPPTAIFCFSDYFALYVYEALNKLGIKIPEDISVMGFCGYPGSAMMDPPLSTIDLEYNKAGELAIGLISKAEEWYGKKSRSSVPQVKQSSFLKERESTGVIKKEVLYA